MTDIPDISSLSTEEPAGPTIMAKTHENAMRKTNALMKPHLNDRKEAKDAVTATVLSYLEAWAQTYYQGSQEAVASTERVILQIRQDTIQQLVTELAKG